MSQPELEFIRPGQSTERWDAFVKAHPKGSVFHLDAILRAFGDSPKHSLEAEAVVGRDGKVVAILPAIRVFTLSRLLGALSSRSLCYAEPICESSEEGETALKKLVQRHDRRVRLNTLFAEIRSLCEPTHEQSLLEQCGYTYKPYLNYLVDTDVEEATLWSRLSKSARSNISKSKRRGVEVEIISGHDAIDRVYPLIAVSYSRSRLPLASVELFHSVLDYTSEATLQMRIATYQGADVAGGIGLVFQDRFFAWYGGAERLPKVCPFDLLTWHELQWCAENNMRLYDFGGAGWPEEAYGPREFKAKFGGQLVHYGRYTRPYSKLRMAFANSAFEVVRGVIAK